MKTHTEAIARAEFPVWLFRFYSWQWFYLPHLFGRPDTRRLEMVQEELPL